MSTITIHALDEDIEKRIRRKAGRECKSLNKTIKEILIEKMSGTAPPAVEFKEFAGVWSEDDLREFTKATAGFEQVDDEDWKL